MSGRYEPSTRVAGETVRCFVPDPLPPKRALDLGALSDVLIEAHLALGRLDGVSALLPDTSLFLYTYVRREAVLSSQIEGTQSSLSDLLLFEVGGAPGAPAEDAREVSRYVRAMAVGLQRFRDGVPISGRLFREMHAVLLSGGRGREKEPGEYRRSQNWVGGARPGVARFVPPPPARVAECMGELERFLHDRPTRTAPLVKAALAHVQFETIHPFLDGNGRLGRLLVTLLLCTEGILHEPLLYLSLHFRRHRARYYDLLQVVREEGDWEQWLAFFLEGVRDTAVEATETAEGLSALFRRDRDRIRGLRRASGNALRVHEVLAKRALVSISLVASQTGLTFPTVSAALARLDALGIAREVTGRARGRLFAYDGYLRLLGERPVGGR